jgi:hypothetical protein
VEIGRWWFKAHPDKNLARPSLREKPTLVVPATQEAEVGGSLSKVRSGKSRRLYVKNKLKQKELGAQVK